MAQTHSPRKIASLGAKRFLHSGAVGTWFHLGSILQWTLSNQTLRSCLVCPANVAQHAGGGTFSLAEMLILLSLTLKQPAAYTVDSCVNHRGVAWRLSRSFGCRFSRTWPAPLGTRGWGAVIWRVNIWDFVNCSRDSKTITKKEIHSSTQQTQSPTLKMIPKPENTNYLALIIDIFEINLKFKNSVWASLLYRPKKNICFTVLLQYAMRLGLRPWCSPKAMHPTPTKRTQLNVPEVLSSFPRCGRTVGFCSAQQSNKYFGSVVPELPMKEGGTALLAPAHSCQGRQWRGAERGHPSSPGLRALTLATMADISPWSQGALPQIALSPPHPSIPIKWQLSAKRN